jgi:hypothetical protein
MGQRGRVGADLEDRPVRRIGQRLGADTAAVELGGTELAVRIVGAQRDVGALQVAPDHRDGAEVDQRRVIAAVAEPIAEHRADRSVGAALDRDVEAADGDALPDEVVLRMDERSGLIGTTDERAHQSNSHAPSVSNSSAGAAGELAPAGVAKPRGVGATWRHDVAAAGARERLWRRLPRERMAARWWIGEALHKDCKMPRPPSSPARAVARRRRQHELPPARARAQSCVWFFSTKLTRRLSAHAASSWRASIGWVSP